MVEMLKEGGLKYFSIGKTRLFNKARAAKCFRHAIYENLYMVILKGYKIDKSRILGLVS
jgi:hypothetical protein